ncbi:hypothetical protein V7122_06400 [Bacillus sp. JJ1532]|uniref:hypothetical protein n=1 Tax=Bacillus sp. JJ1532 TaxID=3122958 RepID=UPI002FFF809C
MDESRLDKIEEMLTTLITMVGGTNSRLDMVEARLSKVEESLDKVEEELKNLKKEVSVVKEDQKQMRSEIMEKLMVIQADQDLIWEKAVKNERDIVKMKAQLHR